MHVPPSMGEFLHCVRVTVEASHAALWRRGLPSLHICAWEYRLQTEILPNEASLYLIQRHLVPGWVACTQCRNPRYDCDQLCVAHSRLWFCEDVHYEPLSSLSIRAASVFCILNTGGLFTSRAAAATLPIGVVEQPPSPHTLINKLGPGTMTTLMRRQKPCCRGALGPMVSITRLLVKGKCTFLKM